MRAQSIIKWAVPIIMLTALTGCVTPMSGDVYSRNNAMQMQTVQYGTIESLRGVRIAGTKTPIGAIGGAVVGGLLGSGVGGGLGRDLATVGGAIGWWRCRCRYRGRRYPAKRGRDRRTSGQWSDGVDRPSRRRADILPRATGSGHHRARWHAAA